MKRILSVVFSFTITFCCLSPVLAVDPAGFSDVSSDDWFTPYVELCVEKGLMQGTGEGRFEPDRLLTDPECLTLILRLYDLRQGGGGVLQTAPAEWASHIAAYWWRDAAYTYETLQPAERTAFHDLIWFSEDGGSWLLEGYDITSRLDFALALDAAAGELEPINRIEAIPDTTDQAVLRLYQAGVLTGIDESGVFCGAGSLTRAECAAMAARVLEPSLRKSFQLDPDAAFTPFEENGLYGLKDAAGAIRIPAQYAYLMIESDGAVIVTDQKGNKGILDVYGNVVIPCLYPRIYNSPDELGLVVVGSAGDFASPLHYNGKKGMIDAQGTVVIPLKYDFLVPFENGQASFLRMEGQQPVFGHLLPDGTELPTTADQVPTDDPLYPALYLLGLL